MACPDRRTASWTGRSFATSSPPPALCTPMRRRPMTSSTEISAAIFEEVKAVVMVTLDIEDQADDLGPETGLYGNFAELDSLTVVKLIVALRKRFGIDITFGEIVGDVLYTVG